MIPVSSLNCSTEVFSTFIDNDYPETHWQVIKLCDFNAIDYHTKTVLSIEYARFLIYIRIFIRHFSMSLSKTSFRLWLITLSLLRNTIFSSSFCHHVGSQSKPKPFMSKYIEILSYKICQHSVRCKSTKNSDYVTDVALTSF